MIGGADADTSSISSQQDDKKENETEPERKILSVESQKGLTGNLNDITTTWESETDNTSTVSAGNLAVRNVLAASCIKRHIFQFKPIDPEIGIFFCLENLGHISDQEVDN